MRVFRPQLQAPLPSNSMKPPSIPTVDRPHCPVIGTADHLTVIQPGTFSRVPVPRTTSSTLLGVTSQPSLPVVPPQPAIHCHVETTTIAPATVSVGPMPSGSLVTFIESGGATWTAVLTVS